MKTIKLPSGELQLRLKPLWMGLITITFIFLETGALRSAQAAALPISGPDTGAVASFMCDTVPTTRNGSMLPNPPPVFQFSPDSAPTGVCGTSRLGGDLPGDFYFVAIAVDPIVNEDGEFELHVTAESEFFPDSGGVLYSGHDAAVINTVSLRGNHQIEVVQGSRAPVPGLGIVDIVGGHISIKGSFSFPLIQPVFDSDGNITDLIGVFDGTYSGVLRYTD